MNMILKRCAALIVFVWPAFAFAAISADGQLGDAIPSVIYRPSDGTLWLDAAGIHVTTFEMSTFDPVLQAPDEPSFLCGLIDPCWRPDRIFRLDPTGLGSHRLDQRAMPDLSLEELSKWRVEGSQWTDGAAGGFTSEPSSDDDVRVDLHLTGLLGDVNGNGVFDASDIDLFTRGIVEDEPLSLFDFNLDGNFGDKDRVHWVHELANTWIGDVDLNGSFDSGDFVQLFTNAGYEDGLLNNTWATGDFNGDFDFTSGDLVYAFQDGGYERGQRAIGAVPEPCSIGCAFWVVVSIATGFRKRAIGEARRDLE
ncbi:MAG: hypothetical protein KDB27_07755 [Planctomycetales bacterium]|nr:hypothetical protein [Planctomycetales bacterium]